MHNRTGIFPYDQWTRGGQEVEHGVNLLHADLVGFIKKDRSHLLQFKPLNQKKKKKKRSAKAEKPQVM